jgi:ribonuclease P protein component
MAGGHMVDQEKRVLYRKSRIWKIRGKSNWDSISRAKSVVFEPLRIRYFIDEKSVNEPVRLAFAISKKYGNAVSRNKVRRQIRAALIELLCDKSFEKSLFLLVSMTVTSNDEIVFSDVKTALEKFLDTL